MNAPSVAATRGVAPDVDALTLHAPIPIGGFLPVNAFLLRSEQPLLVDSGIENFAESTLSALRTLIDPAELRWIYLTHVDADHTGCLSRLLSEAPRARVVTTFLGMAKLGLRHQVPPDRIYLLNPGQTLDVGDRRLVVAKPPVYDAPETTMLFDGSTRTLFSSDCFGAIGASPDVASANDVPAAALREGAVTWLSIDSPWIGSVRRDALRDACAELQALSPETILSSHLAPARNLTDQLVGNVLAATEAAPFVGPDQAWLEGLMAAQ